MRKAQTASGAPRLTGYIALAGLFFGLSFLTVMYIHNHFSGGKFQLPPSLFHPQSLLLVGLLLLLYFLFDGLRLYCVIRALGTKIPFSYILKLVFINIFISNVTPLATGGGFVQVYFMSRKQMTIGQATAATSLRTMLSALILFTLAPIIIWIDPNQFSMFSGHHNLLFLITVVSLGYLVLFWIILFKIRMVKLILFKVLSLLTKLRILSIKKKKRSFVRLSAELRSFSKGFRRYFKESSGWAALSVLCTMLFLLMLFSFSIALVRIMGYQISILTMLAFQVVLTFFMYFAPTPGATGVAEGGYGLLFAQVVQSQDIAALTLSWRFLTIYVGVLIGIVITFGEIFRSKRQGANEE